MTPSTHTSALLDTPPVPVQARLAAAWTSFMFLYVYVDVFGLYKPGTLDDILVGVVFEFEISPALLTVFFGLVAIPALMVVLSITLPARANRIVNLVVASLYVPVTVFNAVGESWSWMIFFGLAIALELLLLAFILRTAWDWPRANAAVSTRETTSLRESA